MRTGQLIPAQKELQKGDYQLQIGDIEAVLRQTILSHAGQPIPAIIEAIANAVDEEAHRVVIVIDRLARWVMIHDDGQGFSEADAMRIPTSLFKSIKVERGLKTKGRFGRALLYMLALGDLWWIGREKGQPTVSFYIFRDLSFSKPERCQSRFVSLGEGKNRVVFTSGATVVIQDIPPKVLGEIRPELLIGAITDAFATDFYAGKYQVGVKEGEGVIQWATPVTRGAKRVLSDVLLETRYSSPTQLNKTYLYLYPSKGHTVSVHCRGQLVVDDLRDLHSDFKGHICLECGLVGGALLANECEPDPLKRVGFALNEAFAEWRRQVLAKLIPRLNAEVEPLLIQLEEKEFGRERARVSRALRTVRLELQAAGFTVFPGSYGGWKAPQRTAGAAGGGLIARAEPVVKKPKVSPPPGFPGKGQQVPYEPAEFSKFPGLRAQAQLPSFSVEMEDAVKDGSYWTIFINVEHRLYQLAKNDMRVVSYLIRCIALELAHINFPEAASRLIEDKASLAEGLLLQHLKTK